MDAADFAMPVLRRDAVQPRIRFTLGLPGDVEVTAYDTIEAIAPAQWDALVPPGELQASHAFVRACEDSRVEDASYWHLAIRRRGELAGVASLFAMPVRLDLLASGHARRIVESVRRRLPGFLRPTVLFCGLPVSAGRSCVAIRSDADAPHVLRALSAAIETAGREADAHLHCVKEFAPGEIRRMDGLRRFDFFRVPSIPTFRVRVSWSSFDEYLGEMRSGYRRQLLASRRIAEREGLRVRRTDDYAADCVRFFALYEQVMDRAQFQLERLNARFFLDLGRHLSCHSSALFIERGDDMLAGAILLREGGRLTFFMAGIDYGENRRSAAYPNLVSEVVAEAIRQGADTVELGQTSPYLKTRLGATGEDRFIYFRCPSRPAHVTFRGAAGFLYPASRLPQRRVFRPAPRH